MVLTMVYKTQDYWVFGLCPSPGNIKNSNTTFRKPDLFPSSGDGWESPTVLGPVYTANLNHFVSITATA
jgi:hypothetical protein